MKRKCKTAAEALQFAGLLVEQGLTPEVEKLVVSIKDNMKSDKARWQRAISRMVGQQAFRRAVESHSMMEDKKLL